MFDFLCPHSEVWRIPAMSSFRKRMAARAVGIPLYPEIRRECRGHGGEGWVRMVNVASQESLVIDELTAAPAENLLASGRFARATVAGVRIAVALLWIENVNWKSPPDFGRHNGSGLFRYTEDAITHPVFPPFGWLVEHLIVPNFVAFGYATMTIEFLLGAFMLAGLLTRFWSTIGLLQMLGITLSALNAPHEWHWSYYLMFAAQFVVLALAGGRIAGVDGLLRPRWSRSRSVAARVAMRLS